MSKYCLKIILILIIASLIFSCAIFGDPTEIDETTGLTDYEVYEKARIAETAKDQNSKSILSTPGFAKTFIRNLACIVW